MEKLEFNIDSSEKSVRIDKYLAECCPDLSRSYLQKLLKDGAVSVNTRIVKANYKTQPGDHVILNIPDLQTPDIKPENIPSKWCWKRGRRGCRSSWLPLQPASCSCRSSAPRSCPLSTTFQISSILTAT